MVSRTFVILMRIKDFTIKEYLEEVVKANYVVDTPLI